MSSNKNNILIFGGGSLQLSIIEKAKQLGLFTVVIDPNPDADGRKIADAFETVGGDDFAGTREVVDKYSIGAIVTAATDKPLVMMARIAEEFGFCFFPVETAEKSTDKFLMKKAFQENGIACARGRLVSEIDDSHNYPVILKPRDNSGSRGVVFCENKEQAQSSLAEAFSFSKRETVLIEEFIAGKEYSIEALHFDNRSVVLQITEKITSAHPYNVELGHIQPAGLDDETVDEIKLLVDKIGRALRFENCASHTEVKINRDGIFVIETSPRLGGDFITSELVPLSTGINMEEALIRISCGESPDLKAGENRASAVFYFDLGEGAVKNTAFLERFEDRKGVAAFAFELQEGTRIPVIKNSLDRYGYLILTAGERKDLLELADGYMAEIKAGVC